MKQYQEVTKYKKVFKEETIDDINAGVYKEIDKVVKTIKGIIVEIKKNAKIENLKKETIRDFVMEHIQEELKNLNV